MGELREKKIDAGPFLCYSVRATEVGLFFYAHFRGMKKHKKSSGGGSCAHENNFGMYRVPAAKLQHDKRQESASGPDGNQQVLPFLQETHFTQRNQVIGLRL